MNQNQVEFDSASCASGGSMKKKKKMFDSLELVGFLGKLLWKFKSKKYCTERD